MMRDLRREIEPYSPSVWACHTMSLCGTRSVDLIDDSDPLKQYLYGFRGPVWVPFPFPAANNNNDVSVRTL